MRFTEILCGEFVVGSKNALSPTVYLLLSVVATVGIQLAIQFSKSYFKGTQGRHPADGK